MARLSVLCVLAFLANAIIAAPAPSVLHEKRAVPLRRRGPRIEPDAIIPIRIALQQSNLHEGYDRLMDVSHPDSPRYGQHFTAEEVHDLFAPAQEAVDAVRDWLLSSGVNDADIRHYQNKGWIAVDLPAAQAERLFSAEYYEHNHKDTVRIGCDKYHLPAHISPHVDFVKPGVALSAPLKKRTLERREGEPGVVQPTPYQRLPHFPQNPFPNYQPPPGSENIAPNLRNCGANISIQCIQALYQIPRGSLSDPSNTMGLFETFDAFSAEDISLFFAKFVDYVPPNTSPTVISVDGGLAPVLPGSVRNSGESDIDIDLSQSLIYPQKITLYQVDDFPNASGKTGVTGFLNTFLDSVDGSYCDYTAFGITGDSPGIDAQYPDNRTLGYKGKLECGTYKLTNVVSISYGEAEYDLPKNYVERQCNEFMKLGMQGHSVFVASGDYGVASFPGEDNNEFGCLSGHGLNGTIYNPDYPSGCPYITVVGGTRLYPSDTVEAPESAMQVNLTAFNIQTGSGPTTPPFDFFASGGGFSNFFTPPNYQADVVSNYLTKYGPKVPSYVANAEGTNVGEGGGVYNRAGRGYPDVAANGAFLRVFNNETEFTFFGTSLASPIFGSVINLINEERIAAGKKPVGFVNPVLYANPGVLNDITNGSNPNCGSSGFKTAPGWDPVTGLGTPNYPKMLKLFMSLS